MAGPLDAKRRRGGPQRGGLDPGEVGSRVAEVAGADGLRIGVSGEL